MSSERNALLSELLNSATTDEELAEIERLLQSDCKFVATTLGEIAELFGVNVQTVKQWRTESPPMPGVSGAYPIGDVIRWRLAKLQNNDLNTAQKQQNLELGEIKLQTERMELAKAKGELIERSDVELWAATALIEAREMIMSLPEMLATSSPPELRDFVRSEADRHCRDVLIMLRRKLESNEITQGESNERADEQTSDGA